MSWTTCRPPSRNWWQRNWPWLVPTGCLGLLIAVAVFSGGIVLMVFSMMKFSGAYQTSIHRAKMNTRVANLLGTPLTEGRWVTGNTNVTPQTGNTNLSIPIAGPKDKGTLYVVATKAK